MVALPGEGSFTVPGSGRGLVRHTLLSPFRASRSDKGRMRTATWMRELLELPPPLLLPVLLFSALLDAATGDESARLKCGDKGPPLAGGGEERWRGLPSSLPPFAACAFHDGEGSGDRKPPPPPLLALGVGLLLTV
jgi:hypothetical protein